MTKYGNAIFKTANKTSRGINRCEDNWGCNDVHTLAVEGTAFVGRPKET